MLFQVLHHIPLRILSTTGARELTWPQGQTYTLHLPFSLSPISTAREGLKQNSLFLQNVFVKTKWKSGCYNYTLKKNQHRVEVGKISRSGVQVLHVRDHTSNSSSTQPSNVTSQDLSVKLLDAVGWESWEVASGPLDHCWETQKKKKESQ